LLNQISLKKSLILNNIDLHLNLNLVADDSLITDNHLRAVNINQAEFKHSSAIKIKNEEGKIGEKHIPMTQDLHPITQDSTCNYETLPNKTSSLKRKKVFFQKDSCAAFEQQSKKPHIHKSSKQKHISINDEEHRLFSILSLQPLQNNEEFLTQQTKECVDRIFDFIFKIK